MEGLNPNHYQPKSLLELGLNLSPINRNTQTFFKKLRNQSIVKPTPGGNGHGYHQAQAWILAIHDLQTLELREQREKMKEER